MKNERGSALLTVILIVFVTATIGAAISSFIMMNYKLRNLDNRIGRAEYQAEKIIDTAYLEIQRTVLSAMEKLKDAETNVTNAMESEKNGALIDGATYDYGNVEGGTYVPDSSKMTLKLIEEFGALYKAYLSNNLVNNIENKDNDIVFKTDNIKIIGENKIEIHDIIIGEFDIQDEDYDVIEMFEDNSNIKIITYIETGLVFLLVELYIMIIILGCVEKLFNNIKDKTTPFTLDNVKYIKKISYLIIALILITPISDILFSIILGISTGGSSPFELMSILEILIIFSMSYIFEYGYEIQKDSKGKMYNEENK